MSHPNTVTIQNLEKSGGLSALVMELVDGNLLSERIAYGANAARMKRCTVAAVRS
jgi:hypothetical protein